jgi:hypothetical protein
MYILRRLGRLANSDRWAIRLTVRWGIFACLFWALLAAYIIGIETAGLPSP